MSLSVQNLKSISYSFDFFDTVFRSHSEEYQEKWGRLCEAHFALNEYSGSNSSSGEWVLVMVKEDVIEVQYKTGGVAGYADKETELPADATKRDVEQAIKKYV